MFSMLRRWIGRRDYDDERGATSASRSDNGVEQCHGPVVIPDERRDLLFDDRGLAQRYGATLFTAGSYTEGTLTDEERMWLQDWQERVSLRDDSFVALVPRLPVVMPKLMAALRDPEDIDLKRVANLIESDPVLSANVLQVVNSAAMRGTAGDIDSIPHAVTRMGRNSLREVMSAAIVTPLYDFRRDARLNDEALRSIWSQSLQIAANVKAGARLSGMPDRGFVLYLAALFHSAGLMVLLRELKKLQCAQVSSDFVSEFERLARYASTKVASGWEFDEEVAAILEAWAEGKAGVPDVALLSHAIEFGRVHYLCWFGHFDPDFCETYRSTLPDYARGWTCRLE